VILNSSTRADDGVEAFGTYPASKAALRSYTRTWANELKGRGIRVNAISPGVIDTPAIAGMVGEESTAARTSSEGNTAVAHDRCLSPR
jgi:NAD(P)-dependent dehydrogenase (short-subunit alcohol dehydrogenase family)